MNRTLIFGATSAIAEATARRFAARGDSLFLVARNAERLQAVADDLRVRGAARVAHAVLDAADIDHFEAVLDAAATEIGALDAALIAHGTLPDQLACQGSPELTRQALTVNAISYLALCSLLANRMEAQGHGVIAVISSVAGDRGRQSNYVYGTAKATVSTFASGLRQRLRDRGVRIVTVKPGFVDTPMTAQFKKGLLWASPDSVAEDIVRAMDRGTPVIYTPWFWRPIMAIIRAIPEVIFRRLHL
jgi:hypothetical protein